MPERYDQSAAAHYAAYRPPLHAPILRRALGEPVSPERFGVGVDVGCGTGASAHTLAVFCARVYGVEPSAAMRAQAVPHARVTYVPGASDAVPLPEASADLVTLAGVLPYTDRHATAAEVRRLCRPDARIIVYDFALDVRAALGALGIGLPQSASGYDHRANFSGCAAFVARAVASESTRLVLRPEALAHLVLSDSTALDHLAHAYDTADPFGPLARALRAAEAPLAVPAVTYHAVYTLAP